MNGIEATKIAKTGVGRPINDFSCFISMLKFVALLLKIATINAIKYGAILFNSNKLLIISSLYFDNIKLNKIKLGATPNVTISAIESNCFSISLLTFNKRAIAPSKKSSIAPINIQIEEI